MCAIFSVAHRVCTGLLCGYRPILNAAPDMTIVKTGWLSAVPYVVAILGIVDWYRVFLTEV